MISYSQLDLSMKSKFFKSRLFFDIEQFYRKWVRKYILVFDYNMKNELKDNLLIFYLFFQVY